MRLVDRLVDGFENWTVDTLCYKGEPGDDIDRCAIEAHEIVRDARLTLALKFNDRVLLMYPDEELEVVQDRWSIATTGRTMAQRREAEARHKEEFEAEKLRMEENAKKKPWEAWYARAKEQTMETLPDFMREVMAFDHDYNTVVEGIAACAVGAAWAADRAPSGGITGFQSGFVMWRFIAKWLHKESPLKLMDYDRMLYPQYEDFFEKAIDKDTHGWLIEEAKKRLAEEKESGFTSPRVVEHWKKIAEGWLPFGFTVSEEK